jgi:hypothetical protein
MALIEKSFESLNALNWYKNVTKSGTATTVDFSGADPNVELRIVNGETSSIGSITYPDFIINPELTSFEFNTEIYWTATQDVGGDNYQITFGNTMPFRLYFNFWDNLQELGSPPPSLAWFLKSEGKAFLLKEYESFNMNLNKEEISLNENKIGEDKKVCQKPKTLLEFIRYGKKT